MKEHILVVFTILASFLTQANGIRVDLNLGTDPRKDVETPRWYNWLFTNASQGTQTYKGISITLRKAGSTGSGLKSVRYQPLIYNRATVTLDGVTVDGTSTGGTMEMVLKGLSAGKHSLVTYHSWIDAVSNGSTMEIAVDGIVQKRGIKIPSRVTSTDKAAIAYIEFTATSGKDVIIRFRAEGNGSVDNVILNGFEIDGGDPSKMASDFLPKEADFHWEQTKGLSWKSATGASAHNVYLGTDSTTVEKATTASDEFKGSLNTTNYALNNLTTFAKYWWRVDEKFPDGTIVKGDVIPFMIARLAFPTAEGYGRYARGGRGGRVVFVTNLNDSGPGSLRDAVEVQKGPRIVIFKVGGTINLTKRLTIPKDGGDVYVAGQTAPGDGICVARYGFGALGASDVIIRHIRTRVGDYAGMSMDGMGLASCDYSIIDHCSISWTVDEGASSRWAKNISFQYNIISEALNNSVHSEGKKHAFAASISGDVGSFHHNLLAHCTGRNWSLAGGLEQDGIHYGGKLDITNNVIYNWRDRTTDGGVSQINFVNNYYKTGPVTTYLKFFSLDGDELGTGAIQKGYLSGNKMVNSGGGVIYSETGDPWAGANKGFIPINQVKSLTPFFPSYITTQTADQAYNTLIVQGNVGATFPKRDAIDTRILNEVKNGTYTYTGSKDKLKGILDSQNDAGGYPNMKGGTPPIDSDNDGMPDSWEIPRGLNPNKADNNDDRDGDGYTNLEEYLGCLIGEFTTCDVLTPKPDCNGVPGGTAKLDDCNICTGGNTGKTPCVKDCNGELNGTATLDNCDRCVGGNTGKTACISTIETEDEVCDNGTDFFEDKNAGFKGTGYINVENVVGSGITFKIKATTAGSKTLSFRYASGGTGDRAATVRVNGSPLVANLSFPSTGAFTTYKTVDVALQVNAGINTIALVANTVDGLANIDQFGFVSTDLSIASCDEIVTSMPDSRAIQSVNIYPNPSRNSFHITTPNPVNIDIMDSKGSLVRTYANVSSLEFGHELPSGVYFARIGDKVYKVVKY